MLYTDGSIYGNGRGVYIDDQKEQVGRGFLRVWGARITGASGWGLTYLLTYDSIDIRGQEINRKEYMNKENIIKLLRHELSICDKLYAEYRDAWLKAIDERDEVGARCYEDMRIQIAGEKLGIKIAIKYIEEN